MFCIIQPTSDPVKQEAVQLIKGNITLERDPIIRAVKLTIARFYYNLVSTVSIKKTVKSLRLSRYQWGTEPININDVVWDRAEVHQVTWLGWPIRWDQLISSDWKYSKHWRQPTVDISGVQPPHSATNHVQYWGGETIFFLSDQLIVCDLVRSPS